ncbi:MAG: D-alanyl-D-alanine carboxypeptidase/D-alanyl-D-alanine-endopeptidase [Bifidobacteriaceae bacterium]|nr:D-alanyl-D-alanine carboxypeptidase/D-alanyl-D-alanine-endopeptidase [Bifidobacteriaceae bacterium]
MQRRLVVIMSVILTISLCCTYITLDILDIAPGYLSYKSASNVLQEQNEEILASGNYAGTLKSAAIDKHLVEQYVNEFLDQTNHKDDVSVIIGDESGNILSSVNADTLREPASVLKTVTALAAASTLDMGSTLDTEVYLKYEQNNEATLILKGNGDMLLGSGASDSTHINGRAGLETLAKKTAYSLSQRGVKKIKLAYDDSLFEDNRTPEHIGSNNDENRYYTPVSSMAIDGGRQWNGSAPANPDSFSDYPVLSTNTAADVASMFKQRLQEQGVEIDGDISRLTVKKGSPIASVQSASLHEIMAFMMRHSDNTLAEEFGRLTALKLQTENSPAGAVQAVKKALEKYNINTTELHMNDCSGLSEGTRVSPSTLFEIQVQNLKANGAASAAEGLSVPGLIGTARRRIIDERDKGLLRVKTGTLSSTTSMTGTATRVNGGAIVFTILVNNSSGIYVDAHYIDVLLSKLVSL